MARRTLAGIAALAAASAVMTPTVAEASPPGSKDVTAVLFEWNFASVARECTTTLGPAGYGYVQVSPPAEHIQGSQWWTSYQPVSYRIAGRLGDRTAFRNMVDTCHAAGVKVVADTVINHMSAYSGTGTGGSSYTKYDYPGLYSSYDFDNCTSEINNYGDRWNVQNCELVGLSDLDTGEEYVRKTIAGYMNDLLSLGVDGFRIDAAKHIPAADLANIKSRLTNPSAYWKQEVIYGAGEAVQPGEYTGTGDVQEFRYAYDLKRVFNNENLAYLKNYGEGWGYLKSGSMRRLRRQPRHRAQRLHAQLQGQRQLHPGQRLHAGLALRRPGHQLRLRVHGPRRRAAQRRARGRLLAERLEVPAQLAGDQVDGRVPQRHPRPGRHRLVGQRRRRHRLRPGQQGLRGDQPRVRLPDPHLPDLPPGRHVLRRAEQQAGDGGRFEYGSPRPSAATPPSRCTRARAVAEALTETSGGPSRGRRTSACPPRPPDSSAPARKAPAGSSCRRFHGYCCKAFNDGTVTPTLR